MQGSIPRRSSGDRRISNALQFINANLSDKGVSTSSIAQAAAMSRHHFCRSFRATVGTTPMRYLKCSRVQAAMRALSNTGASLSDIAHECGFSSQSQFTTAFRQATGSTPAVWRETSRETRPALICPVNFVGCPITDHQAVGLDS